MLQYFQNIWEGFWTPLVGLSLTWRKLFTPAVTMQYPEERWELPINSRMQLFVNMDDCIGCLQCERVCPVQCISIDTVKAVPGEVEEATTGHKKRLHVTKFDIDMVKCCYCDLCTFPCPTECIYMTPSFEDSSPDRYGLVYHFVNMTPQHAAELEEKARKFDEAEAARKSAKAAEASATATA